MLLLLWTGVSVCLFVRFPWLARARTPRKCFAHCAGLCLLVRKQQRFVLSMHQFACGCYAACCVATPACMRKTGCSLSGLHQLFFLLMRTTALHPAVSLPPARAAHQLFATVECASGRFLRRRKLLAALSVPRVPAIDLACLAWCSLRPTRLLGGTARQVWALELGVPRSGRFFKSTSSRFTPVTLLLDLLDRLKQQFPAFL